MFEQRLDALTERLNAMQEGLTKYQDYKPVSVNQLPFHNPQNSFEESITKKIKTNTVALSAFITILSGAIFASLFLAKTTPIAYLICGLLFALCVFVLFQALTKPAVCVSATVVDKTFDYNTSGTQKSKYYYVSAKVDYPEMVIAARVPISKKDYEIAEIGSNIVVVSIGTTKKASL